MTSRPKPRPGLTLLEVLLSLSIFLLSLVAITQLMNLANEQGQEMRWQATAMRLAQSKLAELNAGVISLSNPGSGTFEEEGEADWNYSIESQSDSVANLYLVTLRVYRERGSGDTIETKLSQYIIDPAARGGLTTSSSADSSSSSSGSTTSTPSATSSTSSAPAATPAPAPAPAPAASPSSSSSAGKR